MAWSQPKTAVDYILQNNSLPNLYHTTKIVLQANLCWLQLHQIIPMWHARLSNKKKNKEIIECLKCFQKITSGRSRQVLLLSLLKIRFFILNFRGKQLVFVINESDLHLIISHILIINLLNIKKLIDKSQQQKRIFLNNIKFLFFCGYNILIFWYNKVDNYCSDLQVQRLPQILIIRDNNKYIFFSIRMMQKNYSIGDIIWTKIDPFPWWPAKIRKIYHYQQITIYYVYYFVDNTHDYLTDQYMQPFPQFQPQFTSQELQDQNLIKSIKSALNNYEKINHNHTQSDYHIHHNHNPQINYTKHYPYFMQNNIIKPKIIEYRQNEQVYFENKRTGVEMIYQFCCKISEMPGDPVSNIKKQIQISDQSQELSLHQQIQMIDESEEVSIPQQSQFQHKYRSTSKQTITNSRGYNYLLFSTPYSQKHKKIKKQPYNNNNNQSEKIKKIKDIYEN